MQQILWYMPHVDYGHNAPSKCPCAVGVEKLPGIITSISDASMAQSQNLWFTPVLFSQIAYGGLRSSALIPRPFKYDPLNQLCWFHPQVNVSALVGGVRRPLSSVRKAHFNGKDLMIKTSSSARSLKAGRLLNLSRSRHRAQPLPQPTAAVINTSAAAGLSGASLALYECTSRSAAPILPSHTSHSGADGRSLPRCALSRRASHRRHKAAAFFFHFNLRWL